MAIVNFRDGPRDVAEHLAILLRNVETYRLTFREALDSVNFKMENDFVAKAMNKSINDHFRERR